MTQTTLPSFTFPTSDELDPHATGQPAASPSDANTLPASIADGSPSRTEQITLLCAVVLPIVGLALAIAFLWGRGITWLELGLFIAMYVVTAGGITVGYHRLFTHSSFDTPKWIRALFAIAGSMAVQGPVLTWVAVHRKHHQHSDQEEDPHSPHAHGGGVIGMLKGMWHAHLGWVFEPKPHGLARYVKDLIDDRTVLVVDKLFPVWVALGLALPAVIAGIVTQSWTGALLGFIWGGLVRVFMVHHVTWSINSVCHVWGTRPFKSHDQSTNNLVFGMLALGEGWHNNHHAFPTSAKHGLRWYQFDASYLFIRTLSLLGLARNVRVPSKQRIESKLREAGR
ncbi:MAG TPA: fatty acid desaturase [Tepidisphaeraceae bacterium]|nr:fatty acid desaturase [Tepidisphaeraceae bacterium]